MARKTIPDLRALSGDVADGDLFEIADVSASNGSRKATKAQILTGIPLSGMAAWTGSLLVAPFADSGGAYINVMSDPTVRLMVSTENDCSAAIQALIDDNPGRKIYFPAGNYHLETRLTVSGEGTTLCGESMGFLTADYASVLTMDTPGEPVVIIASGATNGGVCDMVIEGCEPWIQSLRSQCVLPTGVFAGVTGYADINGSEQDGIRIGTSFARVQNVMIRNCGRDGVRFTQPVGEYADTCRLDNVFAMNCRGNGFYFASGDDTNASNLVNCSAVVVMLWAVDDRSFLGNTFSVPYTTECNVLSTAGAAPPTGDNDPSHPANEVTVNGNKIPAGNISWTRASNLVTLTITDWAYLLHDEYPLVAGHGVVITGTTAGILDGTHLLVSATQGASTTTVTFNAPGADQAVAQTVGKIRLANPDETFTKAIALLRADGQLTATENLGGDFHRTGVSGVSMWFSPYAESSKPLQLSTGNIVLGFLGAGGIDFDFGVPMVMYGVRNDSPTTNMWSQLHEADFGVTTYDKIGDTADQDWRHKRVGFDGVALSMVHNYPGHYRVWDRDPLVDVTAVIRIGIDYDNGRGSGTYGDGRLSLSARGDSAVEINRDAGTKGLKVLNGSGAVKMSLKPALPADGDIESGECCLWFDASNGASKLMIKAKSTNGTVVTGEVALA